MLLVCLFFIYFPPPRRSDGVSIADGRLKNLQLIHFHVCEALVSRGCLYSYKQTCCLNKSSDRRLLMSPLRCLPPPPVRCRAWGSRTPPSIVGRGSAGKPCWQRPRPTKVRLFDNPSALWVGGGHGGWLGQELRLSFFFVVGFFSRVPCATERIGACAAAMYRSLFAALVFRTSARRRAELPGSAHGHLSELPLVPPLALSIREPWNRA